MQIRTITAEPAELITKILSPGNLITKNLCTIKEAGFFDKLNDYQLFK
jgi:hypothetical protein